MKNRRYLPGIRLTVASDMASLGANTAQDLIQICGDANQSSEKRAFACSLLGKICARSYVFALIGVGQKEDDNLLVWEAFAAIGAIGSRRATRPLMRLVRTTPSSPKRQAAVFALGCLHDERARWLLIKVLADKREDPKTRGFAAEALGLLRLKVPSVDSLIRALEDSSAEVRCSALCALGALRARRALSAIRRLLHDQTIADGDKSIAYYAALAISDIENA